MEVQARGKGFCFSPRFDMNCMFELSDHIDSFPHNPTYYHIYGFLVSSQRPPFAHTNLIRSRG